MEIDKDTLCKLALFVDIYSVEQLKQGEEGNYKLWRKFHHFIQNEIKTRDLGRYYYDNYFFENMVKEHHTSKEIEEKYPLDGGYAFVLVSYITGGE